MEMLISKAIEKADMTFDGEQKKILVEHLTKRLLPEFLEKIIDQLTLAKQLTDKSS